MNYSKEIVIYHKTFFKWVSKILRMKEIRKMSQLLNNIKNSQYMVKLWIHINILQKMINYSKILSMMKIAFKKINLKIL